MRAQLLTRYIEIVNANQLVLLYFLHTTFSPSLSFSNGGPHLHQINPNIFARSGFNPLIKFAELFAGGGGGGEEEEEETAAPPGGGNPIP